MNLHSFAGCWESRTFCSRVVMKQLQQFPTTYTSRSERERRREAKSMKKRNTLPMEEGRGHCMCIVSWNLLHDVFGGIVFSSTLLPLSLYYNYLFTNDLYSPVHNVLDACISITWASRKWEGVGSWNSRVFWALWNGIEPIGECHLGPKNSRMVVKNQL